MSNQRCPPRPRSPPLPCPACATAWPEETRAEVYFDRGRRGLYATDASLYQIEPVGVVVPRTVQDVIATVRIAAEEHVAIVPRGAATSLSGQTIGAAIVIDFSKYLNRIGIVDRDTMTVRVEPGVVLDQLNAHLKPLGLMFGPDVSTSDRATIGGMIGNNSAGARSLRYGKTVDHVRALEVVLADGTPARLGPVSDRSWRQSAAATTAGPDPSRRARHRGRASAGHHRPVSPHPSPGQRLQSRRVRPGAAGAAGGLGRRALAVQPRPADRRLRGIAGRGHGGRSQGRADPSGTGAGGALVRHDSRGARAAGRDRGDRSGGRRDARPDDPRPGRGEPPLLPLPQLRRGPPGRGPGRAVLRRLPGRARRAGRRPGPGASRAARECWAFARA